MGDRGEVEGGSHLRWTLGVATSTGLNLKKSVVVTFGLFVQRDRFNGSESGGKSRYDLSDSIGLYIKSSYHHSSCTVSEKSLELTTITNNF